MVGRTVGIQGRRRHLSRNALRQREYPIGSYRHLFRKASPTAKSQDRLPQFQALNLIPQFGQNPSHLSSWRKREFRLKLILVLNNQHIWKIHPTSRYGDDYLFRASNRTRNLLHLQGVGKSKMGTKQCFHDWEFLPKAWRYKRRKKEGKLARKG